MTLRTVLKLKITGLRGVRASCLLAVLGLATACGGPDGGGAADAGDETFIALQRDFAGFQSWTQLDGGTTGSDSLPTTGQRTIYINHAPDPCAKSFPIGTIIVKTTEGAQTFGMAKRGGGFNPQGALDWEWFELTQPASGGNPLILWRGTAPPAGETYNGTPTASCNACHTNFTANDFVGGTALTLSSHCE